MIKYPRTKHIEDSKLQPGDEGMNGTMFSDLPDDALYLYEEKVDGANCGFFFDGKGDIYAQSRGHLLNLQERNFPREDDWKLFKDWLLINQDDFLKVFEDRYIVYGEWLGIVHSVFYDNLPNYFLEFDIYDRKEEKFLTEKDRMSLTHGLPIFHVPVLYEGLKTNIEHLKNIAFQSSEFQTENWKENLKISCNLVSDNYEERLKKLVHKREMEGIYIKVEKYGKVIDRYKWVNPNFSQTINESNEHWQSRFPIPNLLNHSDNIFPKYLKRRFK